MRYVEFKEKIKARLIEHPEGLTWDQLKDQLELPYDRPCPDWVDRLERDIGLTRSREAHRSFTWKLSPKI
jgi:hypothetical protein